MSSIQDPGTLGIPVLISGTVGRSGLPHSAQWISPIAWGPLLHLFTAPTSRTLAGGRRTRPSPHLAYLNRQHREGVDDLHSEGLSPGSRALNEWTVAQRTLAVPCRRDFLFYNFACMQAGGAWVSFEIVHLIVAHCVTSTHPPSCQL